MKNISTFNEIPSWVDTEESKTNENQTLHGAIESAPPSQDIKDIPTTAMSLDVTVSGSKDNKELPLNETPHGEEDACDFWNSLAACPRRNFVNNVVNAIRDRFHIAANAKMRCLFIYDPEEGRFIEKDKDTFPVWLYDVISGTDCEGLLTSNTTNEIFSQLLARAEQLTLEAFDTYQNLLNVRNGTVNLDTEELLPHDPKYRFISVVNANYLPEAYESPIHFIEMLDHAFDTDEDRVLFKESLAYLVSGIYSAKKAIVYIGKSNTGKSAILQFLTDLVGKEFVSNIPLEKLSDRFSITTLYGKKINICGEQERNQVIRKTSVIKGLIGGDRLDAEPKGRDHYEFKARTKCLFACNNMPEVDPRLMEDALSNRFIFLEFKNPIPEEKRIENFDEVLFQERDSILTLIVKELSRLKKNRCRFTETPSSRALMTIFKGQKGDIGEFVEDCCELSTDSITPNYMLTAKYDTYCDENCLKKVSPHVFIKELMETYPKLEKCKKRVGTGNPRWSVKGIRLKKPTNVA